MHYINNYNRPFQHPVNTTEYDVYQQINTHINYYINIVINMGVNYMWKTYKRPLFISSSIPLQELYGKVYH